LIIEGAPACSVGYWSNHLLREDTNERVEVVEIRGLTADDLPGALREMQAIASGSRSRGNFMYQANINPLAHEHLTPEQWRASIDLLEKNLGFEGHQRVVIEHGKKGREHCHVIWNRVDVDTLRVVDVGGNFFTHERTAREIEKRFGLERTARVHGERDGPRPDRPPELWEIERAARSGIDPKAIKVELTQLWRTTDTGKAFIAAVEERGYIFTKGDQRGFCVIDHAGHEHSLARRLEGVREKDVRARMANVDREALPSVAAGREQQRAKHREGETFDRDAASRAWENRVNDAGIAHSQMQEEARKQSAREREQMLKDRQVAGRTDNVPPGRQETRDSRQDEARRQSRLEREQMLKDRAGAAKPRDFKGAKTETFEPKPSTPREAAPAPSATKVADKAAKATLSVADTATGGIEKLADFVADLLSGGSPAPPPDPADRIIGESRTLDALERIRESIERGRMLKAEDVRDLSPEILNNLKDKGDSYLLDIIRRMEREEREREQDRGRTRDR
jgi:hypothetical protein